MEKERSVSWSQADFGINLLLRAGLIVFLFFQLVAHSVATPAPELRVSVIAGMTTRTPKKVTLLDEATPSKPIQVNGWRYHFTVLLKNISSHPLKVTTESLSVSGATDQPIQTFRLTSLADMRIEGAWVVPPAGKLGLVDLHPGELAYVNFEFDAAKPLTKIAVNYAPQTLAGGRFGFWTGEVASDFVSVSPE